MGDINLIKIKSQNLLPIFILLLTCRAFEIYKHPIKGHVSGQISLTNQINASEIVLVVAGIDCIISARKVPNKKQQK
jgi:hypothetical protein